MKRALVNELRQLAGRRCDYCQMPERFDPLPFQVDHIIAEQHGGAAVLENLASNHRSIGTKPNGGETIAGQRSSSG